MIKYYDDDAVDDDDVDDDEDGEDDDEDDDDDDIDLQILQDTLELMERRGGPDAFINIK